MRYQTAALLAATVLALGGCAPSGSPAAQATSPPSPVVPAPAAAASPAKPVASAGGEGRTHPGPYFLGRADAPVTVEEYADFQ